MRTLLLVSWMTLPLAGVAYHYGPGQDRMRLDDVAREVVAAENAVRGEDWSTAVARYEDALKQLPAGHTDVQRRLRLEHAKAQMNDSALPTAAQDLSALVDEIAAEPSPDAALLRDARRALASSQFYMTWLLRLEGKTRAEWEPQIEGARQNFRLLAEQAEAEGGGAAATKDKEDLEAAVRLERMAIEDLQGLPLPSQ